MAIPSAIKVFNWTATLYKGSISFATPMLYAFGFIGLFTIGGLTGLFVAALGIDVHVTDTYFVVAHFHYIMVGGTIMAYLGGLHYWWPKMTGRMYPEGWARLSALVIFLGFNLTFFPQFILGYLGMPRRYHVYPDEFQVLHVLSTAGASVLAVGYLMPHDLLHLVAALRRRWRRPIRGAPPGLEWQTPSPPPLHNFDEMPIVHARSLRLQHGDRGGDPSWLAKLTPTKKRSRCASSSIPPRSRRTLPRWGCGSSSSPKSCSSAACSWPTRCTAARIRTSSPSPAAA